VAPASIGRSHLSALAELNIDGGLRFKCKRC
jgi:hypothetical protein